jgi:hypothetical protein
MGAAAYRYVEFPQFRAHISQMTDVWTEKLRCPLCHKIGMACLSQGEDDDTPSVQFATDGFEVVTTQYGPNFHCETCNVVVDP